MVGFLLGWLIDLPLDTFPAFAFVGLALGVVAACFSFYAILKRYL